MNRTLLISMGVGGALCSGLGTCAAAPAVVALVGSITDGHYTNLEPFVQGQMVGRTLGGPCVGLLCGAVGGALVGVLVNRAWKGGAEA